MTREVKPLKRAPSFKGKVREMFKTSGVEAAVTYGHEVGIRESRLRRWIKKWTNGEVTEIAAKPVSVSARAKRVEIFFNVREKKGRWLGAVVDPGPEQSGVRIIECPSEQIVGTIQYFPNNWFKETIERRKLGSSERRKSLET